MKFFNLFKYIFTFIAKIFDYFSKWFFVLIILFGLGLYFFFKDPDKSVDWQKYFFEKEDIAEEEMENKCPEISSFSSTILNIYKSIINGGEIEKDIVNLCEKIKCDNINQENEYKFRGSVYLSKMIDDLLQEMINSRNRFSLKKRIFILEDNSNDLTSTIESKSDLIFILINLQKSLYKIDYQHSLQLINAIESSELLSSKEIEILSEIKKEVDLVLRIKYVLEN